MKTVIYEKYGPPSVLKVKETEKPIPKDNEVLIKVYATTVNRTDCAMLRGKPVIMRFFTGIPKPKNQILGTDFAGVIEAVGEDVKSYKIGDMVFGFNDVGLGSHAQYMIIPEDKALTTIPKNIIYEQAAASSEGAHYAYNFINKVELKAGQKVLVNGATGAIGSAAVQLLKYFGASVTAVCNAKNTELIKSIGADKVIDYTKDDFTKSNERYNFIFDTVGKSSFKRCKPVLESGGVYMSSELGPMAQNIFFSLITPVFGKKKVIFPLPKDIKGSLAFIKKLIEEEKFKAVIDREYSLKEIVDAFRYVETGQKTGNVIITFKDKNKSQ